MMHLVRLLFKSSLGGPSEAWLQILPKAPSFLTTTDYSVGILTADQLAKALMHSSARQRQHQASKETRSCMRSHFLQDSS